ncbi:uncharacterized protein LOC118767432 [Octopus sinensis]|uniref:Uncharacterized protein LOC118767432 n=1 Tax=Octopus sinensis TaxID=2607531 RepID=A0A7E6FM18_9MOLL|nr:uncharacterized protein LOC118767432 [Octopus sinensis]
MEKFLLHIVTLVIFLPPCILTLVKFNLHYTDILVEVYCYQHGGGDLLHYNLDGAYSSYCHFGGVHLSYCLLDETISVTLPSWWRSASVINMVEVTFSIITLMELTLRIAILVEVCFCYQHGGGDLHYHLDGAYSSYCHLGGVHLSYCLLDERISVTLPSWWKSP